ncbi:YjjG family noncanonical pyrimidine nucleotidase [Pleomorphovibrio marinus]|uniref:YjjG family noncanonical pyrimidine nucleotidase n=1 Tax=Pleomorphovibrio marinus TaxID=2164132 RepID=UPI000E0A0FB5|nr:YjjG family noncanonical pyrimidine nucleotidase [Pleomorphovibrio marinus]
MKTYRHLFFDLDHTLWDYNKNARESLAELFTDFALTEKGIASFELFFDAFVAVNFQLWDHFNQGKLDKASLRKVRFQRIFSQVGADPLGIPVELEHEFVVRTSSKPHVFPGALEILRYLKENKYGLHIITNGFNESQTLKIEASGLSPYFDLVVTAETTGYQKPDKRIFEYAIKTLNTNPAECLMIGDNPISDLLGANRVGMDAIFFNPENLPCSQPYTHAIKQLKELEGIL